jgi:hypothetical protein
MITRHSWFVGALVLGVAALFAASAGATVIWNNGPINGTTGSFDITGGQETVFDSFVISGGPTAVTFMTFGAWLPINAVLTTVGIDIWTQPGSGTHIFNADIMTTQSHCAANGPSTWVCEEMIDLTNTFQPLANGTYWLGFTQADVPHTGWDINNGIGCTSPGCPSKASDGVLAQPSSAFIIAGDVQLVPSPEPATVLLLTSGIGAAVTSLRRRKA